MHPMASTGLIRFNHKPVHRSSFHKNMGGLIYHQLMCALSFVCVALITFAESMAVDPPLLPKQILIFGGNGMIGSATVERLIPLQHKLIAVNRGNYYWDTAFTIYPFVQHINCDRWQKLDDCQSLVDYINSVPAIDVVIDFSAYHPQAVQNALDTLNGKAKLYIYISTDSVYEVCPKDHSHFTLESDAVRPSSDEERESFNSKDPYGNHKLQCEETLKEYRENGKGPPFISLRLPDVLGPRDNTVRWWTYQLWMKLQPFLEVPFAIPSSIASKPLSFVYVHDVADLIFNLTENPVEGALDEAFNLAFVETPDLSTVLNGMKEILNLSEIAIAISEDPDVMRFFPSVTLGPVNISKAQSVLKWKPTKLDIALKEIISFYEDAMKEPHFDRIRRQMIRKFQTYFTSKPDDIIHGLIDMYDLKLPRPRDEL